MNYLGRGRGGETGEWGGGQEERQRLIDRDTLKRQTERDRDILKKDSSRDKGRTRNIELYSDLEGDRWKRARDTH